MKLLVLGASSQLGRELTRLLDWQGIEHAALATTQINLLKQMEVVKAVTRISPDQVINVASYSNLEKAEADPEAAKQCDIINSQGVSILAEVCDHLTIPLIHHSSSYVFDGLKKTPYTEADETNPVCRYGLSKWYGERAIREALARHVIVRTDWMFSIHRNRLFTLHIDACKNNKGTTQVMDHRFSPTPAGDVARVLLAIAQQVDCGAEVWDTYHYCALQPVSEAQFVENFLREAGKYDKKLAGFLDNLDIEVVPVREPFIPNTALNCQKIMEAFGIKQRSRAAEVNYVLEDIYSVDHTVQPVLPVLTAGTVPDDPVQAAPKKRTVRKQASKKQPPAGKPAAKKSPAPPAKKAARKK